MNGRLLGLACVALGACSAAAGDRAQSENEAAATERDALALSTVTVLAPLPAASDRATLLGADDVIGAQGRLLPDGVRAGIGQLVEHFTPEESLADLRVVCTRFVPCTRSIARAGESCVGQVRFVMQPLREDASGDLFAQDAAVHVFYELAPDATRAMAKRLAATPGAHQAGPLRVNPRASAFRQVATELAALGAPVRVTFMRNLDVKGNTWVFGGFDARGGAFVPLVIPRADGAEQQRVVTNGSWPFGVSLTPRPTSGDVLGMLLDPIRLGILADSSPDAARSRVRAGHDAAVAIEDPRKHDAHDVDCASCHVAGAARRFAAEIADARGFGPLPAAPPVADGAELTPLADGRSPAEALRACGYVRRTPVISQRAVNDTAVAAIEMGELAREQEPPKRAERDGGLSARSR